MKKLEWDDTKAIREALFHSRLEHQDQQAGRDAALQRVREAEEELAKLLGLPLPFSYVRPITSYVSPTADSVPK